MRVAVQPQQGDGKLPVYNDAGFDLLPIEVVGLWDWDVIHHGADWAQVNNGRADGVFLVTP